MVLFSPLGDRVLAKPMKYASLARLTLSLVSCNWALHALRAKVMQRFLSSALRAASFSDIRPFSYSEKNQNRTIVCHILKNVRMCTMVIEALTPLNRTSRIKLYKNNAESRPFCRIAERSIV